MVAIDTYDDHRMAMAFSLAGAAADSRLAMRRSCGPCSAASVSEQRVILSLRSVREHGGDDQRSEVRQEDVSELF